MDAQLGERLWRFHGGVRLPHEKPMSLAADPEFAGVPPVLVVPLRQHRGDAAEPVVRVGETVNRGQLIGEAHPGRITARVHAPATGVVTAIERREVIHPSGLPELCVEIETRAGGTDEDLPPLDWQTCDRQALIDRIWEAGIVGLGGAVFPTHIKVDPPPETPVDLLIVNGAECEPYIAADETLMRHRPKDVIRGALMVARATGAARTVVAVEDQMGAVEHILRKTERDLGAEDLQIVKVPTIYPEGGERQLIRVLTGKEVPSGGLPLDVGLLSINVGTAVAAYHAVEHGRPLISRVVTVTGRGIREPGNFEALIGTPVSYLIKRAGGYDDDIRKLVMGGPMMGVPLPHDDLPIMKATNALLGLVDYEVAREAPELPCIRCMACERVCPAQLLPQQLLWYTQQGDFEQVEAHALFDCIECGCCAFACPSQIPLVDYYRYAKSEIRARAVERARAAHARHRYEVREERLEREQEQRAQRLQKKREKLRDRKAKQAEIQAAIQRSKARRKSGEESDDAL